MATAQSKIVSFNKASIPKPVATTQGATAKPIAASTPSPSSVPAPIGAASAQKSQPAPVGTATPGVGKVTNLSIPQAGVVPPNQNTPGNQYSNPSFQNWSDTQTSVFNDLQNKINQQFVYDPNTDSALQSQRALYDAGAAKASQSALETMNDRGIMNSSLTASQLGQIQQNANTQFNALIPQYQQAAYNRHRDSIGDTNNLLNNAMTLQNNGFNQSVTEAELTGNYLPNGARQLVDQIYALKSQAETRGITAEARNALSQQADQLRAQLNAMGVNTAGIGSNVNLTNSQVGQQTLAGKQQDYNMAADLRNFEEDVRQYDSNFAENIRQYDSSFNEDARRYDQDYQMAERRYQVADSQWKSEFDQRVKNDGIDAAINWAQVGISQQNANTSSGQLSLSQSKFAYDKEQDAKGGSSSSSNFSSGSGSTKIDSKESVNNYNLIVDDITAGKATKAEARQTLEANSQFLTDSDYKKLNEYINKNL